MEFVKKNRVFSSQGDTNTVLLGTPGIDVTAESYDDGRDIITVLTFSNSRLVFVSSGTTNAYGALIYTFPAGAHILLATYFSLSFDHAIANAAFNVGIGSVIATGGVNTLAGTATFMDYVTQQSAASASGGGAVSEVLLAPTAGVLSGIALNKSSSAKTVYINVADAWPAGADSELYATGTVAIKWCKMS